MAFINKKQMTVGTNNGPTYSFKRPVCLHVTIVSMATRVLTIFNILKTFLGIKQIVISYKLELDQCLVSLDPSDTCLAQL